MSQYNNILAAVGRTPLIRLNRIAKDVSSSIYIKAEFLNPGGSVKDRIGIAMIEAAEQAGQLKPGGTIVEATAGNTGVGLALAAAVKGYRLIVVLPDKMSEEKRSLLRAYGAEVVITPSNVPQDSPESYNGVADRLAREISGAFRPDQFSNPHNPLIHYLTTGPEIWEDSQGQVEVFVAGMGTGGTISGTARYLKERNKNVTIVGADPKGSILSGDSPRSYNVEGIGEDFIPKTFNRQIVDEMVRISDKESFNTSRRLAREEGILAGGSAGTALAAALKYAERLRRPRYIVVLLPDTGRNYLTKIFSDDWMQKHDFIGEPVTKFTAGDVLRSKHDLPALITILSNQTADRALLIMKEHAVSQLPVLKDGEVVGSLNEVTLVKLLYEGVNLRNRKVSEIMGKPMPQVEESVDISEPYRLLMAGHSGVVVRKEGALSGLISRIDLADFWAGENERKGEEV